MWTGYNSKDNQETLFSAVMLGWKDCRFEIGIAKQISGHETGLKHIVTIKWLQKKAIKKVKPKMKSLCLKLDKLLEETVVKRAFTWRK